ncbi:MAG: hypothetical protein IPJ82_04795 [Lewinellaceae bacterium]|nr:hypothetical protein [Lewinellaceae bacterium]
MKKLLFLLLTVLAVAACQNSESPTPDAPATDASKSAQNAEALKPEKVTGRIQASLNDINQISDELDALPEQVKKAKAAEIKELKSMAEVLTIKENELIQQLTAPAKPGVGGSEASSIVSSPQAAEAPNTVAVQSAAETMSLYQKDVEQMKAQLQALKGNQ